MRCISPAYAVMRCLSVRVTFVSCAKTNTHIFKFFSPCGSQAILVFHIKRGGDVPTGTSLTEASNARGMQKRRFSTNISLYLRNGYSYRWARSASQFVSIEFSFHPYNISRDFPRGVPRGNKNVVKIAIFGLTCTHWLEHRITRKLLKIDRYMRRGVWQTLNCLFINATYCVIVEGRLQGKQKQKCGLRYVKTAIFCTCGSNNWETVEHRWVDAARGLASTELFFHLSNVLRILSPKSSCLCFLQRS